MAQAQLRSSPKSPRLRLRRIVEVPEEAASKTTTGSTAASTTTSVSLTEDWG
jgi:hypothetical protein